MKKIVLVCGGREYGKSDMKEWEYIVTMLDYVQKTFGIDKVVSGGATGADSVAIEWARLRKVPFVVYKAEWNKYGNRAGPLRNKLMLDKEDVTMVVAFPGGSGTDNMTSLARARGISTLLFENNPLDKTHFKGYNGNTMSDKFDSEYERANEKVAKIIEDHGVTPNVIYISDDEELQSLMMWVCHSKGIKYQRTEKNSYAE